MSRYEKNIKALSKEENEKLKDFSVCVVGAGGLGGYIIEMLGRIGIGHITIVDGDSFSESNLNRQILSNNFNIGRNKAIEAKERMKVVNNLVEINVIDEFLNEENLYNIFSGQQVIIDAVDDIEARFLMEKGCETLNIPLIHGAIAGWYGQVTTIFPGDKTLKKIYKNKNKKDAEIELGNPSFTPALIASIEVSETIKVLLNKGDILRNELLIIDLLWQDFNIVKL